MKDMLNHTIEDAWDDQVAMMQEIVRIPSITGSEERVQQYMASAMAAQHLDVDAWCPTFDELSGHPAFSDDGLPLGDRPVVVGRWPGNGEGKSIILNGHMDVVPVGDLSIWSYPPWDAVIAEGRLHGRGSCDMKSNVEKCPCGCGLTIAGCRHLDQSCGTSLPIARKIVAEVTSGT